MNSPIVSSNRRIVRRTEHLGVVTLGAIAIGALVLATFAASGPGTQRASLATAYVSLVAILVTLVLGPIRLLRRRPNPVTTDLRRDVGIVAVVTGIAHVVLSIQHHFGGSIRLYFFVDRGFGPGSARTDSFGLGVWGGVVATLLLVGLGALSNDLSVRRMGRTRWKRLQRLNYLLIVIVVVHTAFFWSALSRGTTAETVVLLGIALVAAVQIAGVITYRMRPRRAIRSR